MSPRPRSAPALAPEARKHLDAVLRHGSALRPDTCADCRRIVGWLRGVGLVAEPLEVTAEEAELVREQGRALVDSHSYGNDTPDRKQPTAWHEGRKLLALADRLAAYAKRAAP